MGSMLPYLAYSHPSSCLVAFYHRKVPGDDLLTLPKTNDRCLIMSSARKIWGPGFKMMWFLATILLVGYYINDVE